LVAEPLTVTTTSKLSRSPGREIVTVASVHPSVMLPSALAVTTSSSIWLGELKLPPSMKTPLSHAVSIASPMASLM
jgi:hypothetical protein